MFSDDWLRRRRDDDVSSDIFNSDQYSEETSFGTFREVKWVSFSTLGMTLVIRDILEIRGREERGPE